VAQKDMWKGKKGERNYVGKQRRQDRTGRHTNRIKKLIEKQKN